MRKAVGPTGNTMTEAQEEEAFEAQECEEGTHRRVTTQ